MIMIGSPGAGKTMLAKRLTTIILLLTPDEAPETTKMLSIVVKIGDHTELMIKNNPKPSPTDF
jgi:magnesium chelatase family protein